MSGTVWNAARVRSFLPKSLAEEPNSKRILYRFYNGCAKDKRMLVTNKALYPQPNSASALQQKEESLPVFTQGACRALRGQWDRLLRADCCAPLELSFQYGSHNHPLQLKYLWVSYWNTDILTWCSRPFPIWPWALTPSDSHKNLLTNSAWSSLSFHPQNLVLQKTTSIGEDGEIGGNVEWCSHCGKLYGSFSKN